MAEWGGGLGDTLDISEVIAQEEAWLARTSRFLVPVQDPDCEDVAQEGRIAMWKAAEKYDAAKGPLDMWLKAHARWRMKEVRGRHTWTGKPNTSSGGQINVIQSVAYLSDLLTDDAGVASMLEAADLMSGAEWAYHHGEIAEAMAELTPRQREYVFLRFWIGYQLPQMRDYFGYDPQSLWSASNGAKTRLRTRLAHLVAT